MGKGIIIINRVPKTCEDCPFSDGYKWDYYCTLIHLFAKNEKDKCPIQELPEKKHLSYLEEGHILTEKENIDMARCIGYNECVEEFEKIKSI